jgi:hypothetical protein
LTVRVEPGNTATPTEMPTFTMPPFPIVSVPMPKSSTKRAPEIGPVRPASRAIDCGLSVGTIIDDQRLLAKVKDASANLLQAIARDPPGRRADIGDFSRGHDVTWFNE